MCVRASGSPPGHRTGRFRACPVPNTKVLSMTKIPRKHQRLQSMVQWLQVVNNALARSNKLRSSAPSVIEARSRSPPPIRSWVVKRDQRARKSGGPVPAKLFITRRLLFSSVVLAAGTIAAWSLRKQQVDLPADSGQAEDRAGRGYQGT